jgi:hypothetical protein
MLRGRTVFDISGVKNESGSTITMRRTGKMIPDYARSPGEIERRAPDGLEGSERQAWIDQQIERLRQEDLRICAEWKTTDLGKPEASADEASEYAGGCLWELIWTKPTTLEGSAALLTYCAEHMGDELAGNHEWRDALDWTLASAASEPASLPQPPMSDIVAELWEGRQEDLAEAAA